MNTMQSIVGGLDIDPDIEVRMLVGSNPSTPADTLMFLAQHPDSNVRWAATSNESTPSETLAVLAQHPDSGGA